MLVQHKKEAECLYYIIKLLQKENKEYTLNNLKEKIISINKYEKDKIEISDKTIKIFLNKLRKYNILYPIREIFNSRPYAIYKFNTKLLVKEWEKCYGFKISDNIYHIVDTRKIG